MKEAQFNIFLPYRFWHKHEIEDRANTLLQKMQATPKYAPRWPFDATRVADFLDLGVVWDRIPADEKGAIAAMILPTEREIIINQDVPGLRGGYGESTLAHEIGHWELHINHQAVGRIIERQSGRLEESVQPFLCRNTSGVLEKIEWQAQYFASCLLMPRSILTEKQKGRDLTNYKHLQAMASELGVTVANLKPRLKAIGWIYIEPGSQRIYSGDKHSY